MEHRELSTTPWNLPLSIAAATVLAACGPLIIIPEGETDSDSSTDTNPGPGPDTNPTFGGGECMGNSDCPPGDACFEGQCIPYYSDTDYNDTDYCYDYGCCDYDPYCYGDTDTDSDTDTYGFECYSQADCEPHQVCNAQNICEEVAALPPCPDVPMIAMQGLPTASADAFFSLAFVDANGDAAQDLVVGRNGSAELLLGPGDGMPVALPVDGGTVIEATSGDLDGDGDAELVLSTLEGSLLVLTGDGAGGYTTTSVPLVSVAMRDLATLQWNGDALLDVAGRTDQGTAFMLWGDGAGGFSDVNDLVVDTPVTSLTRSDLDGDAYGDVVLQDEDGVKRYQGSHSGALINDGMLPASDGGARTLTSAALDFIAPFEVVGTTFGPDGTRVELWPQGSESPQYYGLPEALFAAGMGDVDGDGSADLVVGGDFVVHYVRGSSEPSFTCTSTAELPGLLFDMAVGDFDGNLRADVVIGNARGVTVLLTQ